MKKLLDYQDSARAQVIDFYQQYLKTIESLNSVKLSTSTASTMAWESSLERSSRDYSETQNRHGDSIPSCSITIPTGGGKTATGLITAAELATTDRTNSAFIVWMVPSEAIYRQVQASFSYNGAYYNLLRSVAGKEINLKLSTDTWNDEDLVVDNAITVLLLSKDSLVRDTRRRNALLMYKNADKVSRLSCMASYSSPSLFALLEHVKPIFVIDESHKVYTAIGQRFFQETSVTRFVLELSATPKPYSDDHYPNIIFNASAKDLVSHSLIKKRIKFNATIGQNLGGLLRDVTGLRKLIEQKLHQIGASITPRVLISTEYTGTQLASEEYSVDSVCNQLLNLGVQRSEIIIKSSDRDELKNRDLDNTTDPGNFILTKTALVEGWDCKSVYIIVLLNRIGAQLTNTQIIGRGLRQPMRNYFDDEALNTLYLITNSNHYDTAVTSITNYLYENGLSDLQISKGSHTQRSTVELKLVQDFTISHLHFDRSVYNSWNTRGLIQNALFERALDFNDIFQPRRVEHIQSAISMSTGIAGAPTHRELQKKGFQIRSVYGSSDFNTLFSKLYLGLRNFFLSAKHCGDFVLLILENASKQYQLSDSASDDQLLFDCLNRARDIRQGQLNVMFESMIRDKTKIKKGLVSELFGTSFSTSVDEQEPVAFTHSAIEPVCKGLLNNEELDFARFLDSKDIVWFKTTPSFKIDFPYPLGTFYPDFVVSIPNVSDPPTIYVETKGGHLINSEDSQAKSEACATITKVYGGEVSMVFGGFTDCKKEVVSILEQFQVSV